MGVWAAGLYAGDFAMDLRSAISAVAHLPFDGDQLTDILCETEPGAAHHPDDSDHTTFWLVVADQFAKRGIPSERARTAALNIISSGSDLAMLRKLGMGPSDLRKRQKMLAELNDRIILTPNVARARPVLKKPQVYIMEVGDVLIYPTCDGKNINPYFPSKELDKHWTESGPQPWQQNGWGAAVIVDQGRAFDFLVWYRPVVLCGPMADQPALTELLGDLSWKIGRAGTCSPVRYKRLELQKIGKVDIERTKLMTAFPDIRPGTSSAISDICMSNGLNATPPGVGARTPIIPLKGLGRILTS